MKKLLTLFVALLSMSSLGSRILWVRVDDLAVVDDGFDDPASLFQWISSLQTTHGVDPADVGFRIAINNSPMPLGYEDSSGYVPPGQSAPTIHFDYPGEGYAYEAGVLTVDNDDNVVEPWITADWQPVRLDITDKSSTVFFEIGYWDVNSPDWDFVPVAYAWDKLGNIWDSHSYESGTLGPPVKTPWKPDHFYYTVPEPSCGILALLGIALLVRRRK